MIVLIAADGQPARQLLVTKRTAIGAVEGLLGLQAAKVASAEWLIEDGTWAAADPEARLYELAGDLKGDGSSVKKAFRVRSQPLVAEQQGKRVLQGAAPAGTDKTAACAAAKPPRTAADAACAPASPKQLSEAPLPTGSGALLPPPAARPDTASTPPPAPETAAAEPAEQHLAPAVARTDGLPPIDVLRHSRSHGSLASPASSGVMTAGGLARNGSSGGGISSADLDAFEAVTRTRLEATLPLLAAGSHIAVVDARRPAREAMAEALLQALPALQDTSCATPQAFRPLRLTFDSARPFQGGLDGFWRWVLEGLHAGAPDLFPATGLPGDASGFEEAFSADRVRTAPPVVLICSEACALADASSWFVSRFLGTLRDMGNEQHRFFLHAVAMIGGEPLARVDMEAYMCKMSTSLSSTLESTQQLRRSSHSSGRSRSGSVSRRSASSALSKRSGPGSQRGGSRKHGELARESANSGVTGVSSGSSGRSGASAAAAAAAGVRRSVSSSAALGPTGARLGRHPDGRLETLHSAGADELQLQPAARRRSADNGSLAATEAAILASRLGRGSPAAGSVSGSGSSAHGRPGPGSSAFASMPTTPQAAAPLQARSPGMPLSDRVRRLAAAFTRGDPGSDEPLNPKNGGSAADGAAAGA